MCACVIEGVYMHKQIHIPPMKPMHLVHTVYMYVYIHVRGCYSEHHKYKKTGTNSKEEMCSLVFESHLRISRVHQLVS